MDNWISKSYWLIVGVYLFCICICINAQDTRSQYHNGRRKLPTVIITREHLRQRPSLYGSYGDTAAEFIVSAGIDTNLSSAVRIRKLGNRRDNVTISPGPPNSNPIRINHSSSQEVTGRRDFAHYNPNIANERRHPSNYPQPINRRQDVLNERNNGVSHHQRFYPTVDVNVNGPLQRYVPPIFVPYYQQPRGGEPNLRPSHVYRPSTNIPSGWRPSIPDDQEYRTAIRTQSSEPKQHFQPDFNKDKVRHPTAISDSVNVDHDKTNTDQGASPKPEENQQDEASKPPVVHKNIVAETPVLRLNRVKPSDAKNLIIRRPSLVLRDQITVNEVGDSSDRPRFGPRALQLDEVSSRTTRRKRQANTDPQEKQKFSHFESKRINEHAGNASESDIDENGFDFTDISDEDNKTSSPNAFPNLRSILDEFKNRGQRVSRKYAFEQFDDSEEANYSQSNSSMNTPSGRQSPYYSDVNYQAQMDRFPASDQSRSVEDVMSFSDFLASPMAERIRLQRQLMFKNSSYLNGNLTDENSNATTGFDSVMRNATVPLLRNIIAARILHGILNLDGYNSSNTTEIENSPAQPSSNPRSSPDRMTPAEQRQFGIIVSPYAGHEPLNSKSTMPVIRILKGKIVPLPELPQELIPILLGTYRPTYTSEASMNDPKLTDSILDNALMSLLQNEEMMNHRPLNRKLHPIIHRLNRKSPSTNYVGSLKASEPIEKTSFSFKPPEWTLGPRCDRLTEEICLDDSDYPSSAIMSSIYKDKAKFDLMYSELKVRESQVEGLSRQQEQAYSFDHYYGSYSQGSGSSLVPRDYGQAGGFVCPSEVHYGRPHRAKNRKGEWKVVVNVGEYTQTMRMEKCLGSGNPCKYVVSHMQSTCAQVYSYHRLLVFNKEMGLHIDLFRVPTSCTCHLRPSQQDYSSKYSAPVPLVHRPSQYEEYGGHVETAPSPQMASESAPNNDKKNSFSSTLWSILGGGQQGGALAQQPQFLDEVQKQIGWTQQLKQYPQLMKQISPNQVLKQLLEEDEDDFNIRRQRIRQSMDRLNANGFASHPVPIAVPLPPPPPPPMVIARRPVVGSATQDQKLRFGIPANSHAKVITISPTESTQVFSLTKEGSPGKTVVRLSESTQQSIFGGSPQATFHQVKAYKVRPGMYHPSSGTGEKIQVTEASLVPVAPQFSDQSSSEGNLRPILKPLPVPKGSDKRIVEDEDLMAVEKSESGEIHAFKIEEVTEEQVTEEQETEEQATENSFEDGISKINFSYHPILEYLNL